MKQLSIQRVTAYLEIYPQTSAKDLAAFFGYSQFHFSRWFKAQMGVSLRDYMSASKVERGVQALLDDQSVINAQLEAGYESAGTFSNHVKKLTGILPKRYRDRLLELAKNLMNVNFAYYGNEVLYQPYVASQHPQTHALSISIENQSHPDSLLFIACFPSAVAKEMPVLGVCLKQKAQCQITHIPDGRYYLMVIELVPNTHPLQLLNLDGCYRFKYPDPVCFPLIEPRTVTLPLQKKQPHDPPIAVHPLKLLFDILPIKEPRAG